MQQTVESCTSISIHSLQKTIKRLIHKNYVDPSPEDVYHHTNEELRKFQVNGQTFTYQVMKNYLGGHRWFFECPRCSKKSSKLFLPPVFSNREQLYLCKNCHRLKNQSAIAGQNNIYRKVTRPLKKMKEIENKIARGHIRGEKIQELLNEYDRLETELKGSPEYRLYSFKKKHDL